MIVQNLMESPPEWYLIIERVVWTAIFELFLPVFESLDTHEYVFRIIELRVLANAAVAVGREPISRETAVDGAFAMQTRDVCDAGKRRAVLADRRVGRERKCATTTYFFWGGEQEKGRWSVLRKQTRGMRQARTAFEIPSCVNTFPCKGSTAIHTAGCPSRSSF